MKKVLFLILTIILAIPVYSVTRFYLPSTGEAQVCPTAAGLFAWGVKTAITLECSVNKKNTPMVSYTGVSPAKGAASLIARYVSDPIAAQNISGTIHGQVQGTQNGATAGNYPAFIAYVISNDGKTLRGTFTNVIIGTTQYPNTPAYSNRYTPVFVNVTTVNAQDKDRIVFDIGYTSEAASPKTASQYFGDSGVDLPSDEATTQTTFEPWVEFSQTISFETPSVTILGE